MHRAMASRRVTVRQPSGASFEVELRSGAATLQRLKAQIAARSLGAITEGI